MKIRVPSDKKSMRDRFAWLEGSLCLAWCRDDPQD
jgi:hypothetical protein